MRFRFKILFFLFIGLIFRFDFVYSQSLNTNTYGIDYWYKIDTNIILKKIEIVDTNTEVIYLTKDSSDFIHISKLNNELKLNFIEYIDKSKSKFITILGDTFDLSKMKNLSQRFNSSDYLDMKIEINDAYYISSKINNEKYFAILGFRDNSGTYFNRIIFVFKLYNNVIDSFIYSTIDAADNQYGSCYGCFCNIDNGKKIGFRIYSLGENKNTFDTKILYLDNNNYKLTPIKKIKINSW